MTTNQRIIYNNNRFYNYIREKIRKENHLIKKVVPAFTDNAYST